MEYITLNNGVQMPILGLGTYMLQGKQCEDCILDAIDLGYRLFDTAQLYHNEQAVGNALKRSTVDRRELFITTKVYSPNNSYQETKKAIEQSLNKLQTEYIDLFLIHEPYREAEEMYRAMEEAYYEGKIRAIGISNFRADRYLEFVKHVDIIPAINQVEAHVFFSQDTLQKIMEEHGTKMNAWSPFAAGRHNFFNHPVLQKIGKQYDKSTAQIGLRYLVQRGISVIPKSSNKERIAQNLDILDFILSKTDMQKIKQLDSGKSLFGWY